MELTLQTLHLGPKESLSRELRGEDRAAKKLDPGSFSSWGMKQLQLEMLIKILNSFFVLAGNVFC